MAFFAFLGCDGSGKSAVIDQISARLQSTGIPVTCGHWRPIAFSLEKEDGKFATAENPHEQVPRGSISSVFKLAWLWLNWWISWVKKLGKLNRTQAILFDRYHGDLLVDPRRYRYGGPKSLAKFASSIMPQPDLVFFLDAEPDILLARKQEVSRESLQESRKHYLKLTETAPRFIVIDAAKPLLEVVEEIETTIREYFPDYSFFGEDECRKSSSTDY